MCNETYNKSRCAGVNNANQQACYISFYNYLFPFREKFYLLRHRNLASHKSSQFYPFFQIANSAIKRRLCHVTVQGLNFHQPSCGEITKTCQVSYRQYCPFSTPPICLLATSFSSYKSNTRRLATFCKGRPIKSSMFQFLLANKGLCQKALAKSTFIKLE